MKKLLLFFALSISFVFAGHQPANSRADASGKKLLCEAALEDLKAKGYIIPPCPESGTALLTPEFPATAVFIKLYGPGPSNSIKELVEAVQEANSQTVIQVMVAANSWNIGSKLEEKIRKELPKARIQTEDKPGTFSPEQTGPIVQILTDRGTGSSFFHDFGKQLIDAKGKSAFFSTPHPGNSSRDTLPPFEAFLKEHCGMEIVLTPTVNAPKKPSSTKGTQSFGGNYLPLSAKRILTGGKQGNAKIEIAPEHEVYLKKLEKEGIQHTLLDTGFLNVGHVDEILAPVPVKRPPPCDKGVILADSKMAWEYWNPKTSDSQKEKKEGSWFDLLSPRPAYAGITILGPRPESPVSCEHLTLSTLDTLQRHKMGLLTDGELDKALFDTNFNFAKNIEMLGGDGLFEEDKKTYPVYHTFLRDPKNPKAIPKYLELFQLLAEKYCVGFSGLAKTHLADPASQGVTFKQKIDKLKKLNLETIPKIMEENEKKIKEALIKDTGCTDPTIIKVPVLFQEQEKDGVVSVLPNSVNLISLGRTENGAELILPKSTSNALDKQIQEKLKSHGIQSRFSDTVFSQTMGGNLSCNTSILRACLKK